MPEPARPPATFLTAEWRKIVMAQYEVAPEALKPWLPQGLELDLFHGQCFVSLVGFLFDRVRVKAVAIPFHTRFEEVNLRFYVTRGMPDGSCRRGVVFVREFVPRTAITLVARCFYEEPYTTMPMRHSIVSNGSSIHVEYAWYYGARWHHIAADGGVVAAPIAAGTEEEFVSEHYWGYTRRSRGATEEYEVKHPQWDVYPVRNFSVQADFAALYGPAFAALNGAQPASVLIAEGSAVAVLQGTRLGKSR